MENLIDNKLALAAFAEITNKGDKHDDKFEYQGIAAWQDFDGYTCFLGYKDVLMTLMFHGKYDIEFDDKDSLKAFINKLITITQKT
ncbi:DUF3081 family protein [Thalassotalea maritima]|uniref:DUF3081 family protein n=1 Tax=Thalassotalea maritima TaxID=3242416 RepID=UPI0035295412